MCGGRQVCVVEGRYVWWKAGVCVVEDAFAATMLTRLLRDRLRVRRLGQLSTRSAGTVSMPLAARLSVNRSSSGRENRAVGTCAVQIAGGGGKGNETIRNQVHLRTHTHTVHSHTSTDPAKVVVGEVDAAERERKEGPPQTGVGQRVVVEVDHLEV